MQRMIAKVFEGSVDSQEKIAYVELGKYSLMLSIRVELRSYPESMPPLLKSES